MLKTISVLLLEDDRDDQIVFQDALNSISKDTILTIVPNGEVGISMLSNALILPDIIFSDINMPQKSGIAFVEEIKQKAEFKSIPVVLLSTTMEPPKDIFKYPSVTHYSKPVSFKIYCGLLEKIINSLSFL